MQEGTLTWSLQRNSLPLPALRAHGPIRAYSFLALNFCTIFRDVFLYCFFMFFDGFRPPFWRHVGVIFHVFCITFSSIGSTWIFHQFCKDFYMFFEVFLLISMVLHPIGESFKNTCFYITFAFRKHMFFYSFRDMFRCSLFAPFVVIFCTNVGVILAWFWHQNWSFFDTDFLTISWYVFRSLSAPNLIRLGSFWRPFGAPKFIKNHIFRNHAFWISPEGPRVSFGASPGVIWCHFGTVFASCCYSFLMFFNIFWSIGVGGGGGGEHSFLNHTSQYQNLFSITTPDRHGADLLCNLDIRTWS